MAGLESSVTAVKALATPIDSKLASPARDGSPPPHPSPLTGNPGAEPETEPGRGQTADDLPPALTRSAFGDVLPPSSTADASDGTARPPSPAASSPVLLGRLPPPPRPFTPPPPPLKRPLPPKKGILKPARPPARGLLGSLIRPSPTGAVSRLIGDSSGAGSTSSASLSTVSSGAGVVGSVVQHGGERAGAFFSKAFGRLSSVAAGLPLPAGVTPASPLKAPTSSEGSLVAGKSQSGTVSATADDSSQPRLKKATFPLAHIAITYPFSASLPPASEETTSSIAQVEAAYARRQADEGGAEWWTEKRVGELFEWAVRVREEGIDEAVLRAVKASASLPPAPRTLDLSALPLSRFIVDALADVLSLRLGLRRLDLSGTSLAEESLKTLLCALLLAGELESLVLRENRRLKLAGWRTLAGFLADKRARVRFLDLSENPLDRKSIEVLVPSLRIRAQECPIPANAGKGPFAAASDGSVETLRLDGCALRGGALEALGQGVRHSTIRHLSLRNNRIPSLGGVSLAVMIKDYPDVSTTTSSPFTPPTVDGSAAFASNSSTGTSPTSTTVTYAPYTPRRRKAPAASGTLDMSIASEGAALPEIPLVASNSTGGITRRVVPASYRRPGMESSSDSSGSSSVGSDSDDDDDVPRRSEPKGGAAAPDAAVGRMMQTRVRALDDVQRLGRLVTLDLKGNDLRTGVTYIAQVLKRNRTLKVCNLADNRIDVAGLVALAEALKYNSTLDTLDLSSNPCCGPALEGIHALRHAFTLNANLSRLLLSATGLTTSGAIALAEFLPEATHLLHLDLTSNSAVETAGVMALAVGLRANKIVRCLDLSVAVGDEVGLGWSRDILQSCIRNTELAQDKSLTKAARLAVWAPIQKSTLARLAKEADSARAVAEVAAEAATPAGQARVAIFELSPGEVEERAEEAVQALADGVEVGDALGVVVVADVSGAVERGKVLRERLEEMVQQAVDGGNAGDGSDETDDRLQVLLGLIDRLTTQLDRADVALKDATEKSRLQAILDRETAATLTTRSQVAPEIVIPNLTAPKKGGLFPPAAVTPTKNGASEPLSSPNFSIADSDDEDEELLVGSDSEGSDDGVEQLLDLPGLAPSSPTIKKSLKMVEEEGEIFRKGVVLGAAEVDDEEDAVAAVSGEELKKELLHTEVERQTPRRLSVDETDRPLPASDSAGKS